MLTGGKLPSLLVDQRRLCKSSGSVERFVRSLVQERFFHQIRGTERIPNDYVLPTNEMRGCIETFRHGVSCGVPVQSDGGRCNGLQKRLLHVTLFPKKNWVNVLYWE